jgi:hypothetical protein
MRIKTGGDPGGVHILHVLPHGAPVPRLRGIIKGLFHEIKDLLFRKNLVFQRFFRLYPSQESVCSSQGQAIKNVRLSSQLQRKAIIDCKVFYSIFH